MLRHDEFNAVFRAMLAESGDQEKVDAYHEQLDLLKILVEEAGELQTKIGRKLLSTEYGGEEYNRLDTAWYKAGRRWCRRMAAVYGSPLKIA